MQYWKCYGARNRGGKGALDKSRFDWVSPNHLKHWWRTWNVEKLHCSNFWLNLFSKVFIFVLLHSGTFYLQTEKPPDGEEQDQSPKLAGCGGQKQLQGQETCTSKCCKVEAHTFISKMNQTIDPCDDFYQFACGKWIEETELTDVTFGPTKKTLNDQVRTIVLSISSSTS